SLVRHQNLLGRHSARRQNFCRRSSAGFAPQSRLRRRSHTLQAQVRQTCRNAGHLRRNVPSLLPRLSRRNVATALASRFTSLGHGFGRFRGLRARMVALRLQRLEPISHLECPIRATKTEPTVKAWETPDQILEERALENRSRELAISFAILFLLCAPS